MIIRHLPYFVVVAEEESIQAAAVRLNVAQSALSRRMKLLETELGGIELFDRRARGMHLSPAGRALFEQAQRIVGATERASADARSIAMGLQGRIGVGFVEALTRQPRFLTAFRDFTDQAPEIELDLQPMVTADQRAALSSGTLDVGLFYHDPLEEVARVLSERGLDIASEPLVSEDFVLAVPASHPLALLDTVSLKSLRDEPLIWSSRRAQRSVFQRMVVACRMQAFEPRIVMQTDTAEAALNLVAAGIGLAFVLQSVNGRQPAAVVLRPIADFAAPLQLSIVWRRSGADSGAERFVAFVRDKLR